MNDHIVDRLVTPGQAADHTRPYWSALRARSIAFWLMKRPARGSPRSHDPSDSPGRLIHR
jgi:hypothetical protein